MGKPPKERYRPFNSKGFCEMQQSLSFWAITDYGEVRCAASQKLRRPPQGEIASLKRDEPSHEEQLELPITRGGGVMSFLEEGGIDPNLCRNKKKAFPMHSEFRIGV